VYLLPFAALTTTDIEFTTVASWYGPGFHGRKTASGERYDQNKMTAANRTLPFGTKLTVKNLKNGRSCDVVINDRGPYVRGRDIDLSREAARRIGMSGVTKVLCYNDVASKRLYPPAAPTDIETPDVPNVPDSLYPHEDVDPAGDKVAHRSSMPRLIAHRMHRTSPRHQRATSVQYVAYLGSRKLEYGALKRFNNKYVHEVTL